MQKTSDNDQFYKIGQTKLPPPHDGLKMNDTTKLGQRPTC